MAAMLAQSVFEFGPIWLVALAGPRRVLFGPYWAGLVATFGVGGWLAPRIDLDRRPVAVAVALASIAATSLLAVSDELAVVVVAQTAVALLLAVIGIHAGELLVERRPVVGPNRRRQRRRHLVVAGVRARSRLPRLDRPSPRRRHGRLGAHRRRRRWSALSSCSRRSAGPRRSTEPVVSPATSPAAPWWTWSPTTWTAFSTQSAGRRSSGTWPAATAVRPMWPRSARRSPPSTHSGQSSHQPRQRTPMGLNRLPFDARQAAGGTTATSSWHRDM